MRETREPNPRMNQPHAPMDPSARLLQVIETQTEIARLGLDLGAVMALVAERAQGMTGADGAVVELAEDEDMVYRASAGIAEPYLGLRLQRSGSLSGLCVAAGTPLMCGDSETDPRVDVDACRRIGLRSMIVVPLRHHETVVGVLKVMAKAPSAFDDGDIQLLGLMSELIAASMFHATRHEAGELFLRATHDALTGLPNRALFYERLRQHLALAGRESRRCGVISLDMDGLKPINDTLGHRAGDAALCELAARQSDTVARLGGDEFAVLLARIGDREGAQAQAARLLDSMAPAFEYESSAIPLQASVGVAIYPDDSADPNELLHVADQSMYADKRQRKGGAR